MNATEVKLSNLAKTFRTFRGEVQVLKSIDITIEAGSFFVLLGPSGCGKSTLLNLIAGLEEPSQGSISFSGKVVADSKKKLSIPPFERDVSFVFQSYALYPHMTVAQNLDFPLSNLKKKLPEAERKRRVMEAAMLLRIEKLLDRKPKELSGGQRQRVAIGRAIVRNPELFLMDEPLSNLDAKLRMEMRAELKALQLKLGVTTVYVTHDQIEAMTLGDKIAVLNDGIIQQIGTPDEIYSQPENVFVAKFIGSPPMNILKGTIEENDGGMQFKTDDFTIRLREPVAKKVLPYRNKKQLLGIGPECVSVIERDGDFNIDIDIVENIGHEHLLHSFLKNGEKFIVIARSAVQQKQGRSILLEMEKLHIFDCESEKRIVC
jgi:multiple sugar transport system ATP-binding protein